MILRRRLLAGPAVVLGLCGAFACAGAQAAPITVGSPLQGEIFPLPDQGPSTIVQTRLPEPGARVVSPVDGAVIRWRVGQGKGPFTLDVVTPNSDGTYTQTAVSAPQTAGNAPIETFPTALPIKAGQAVGLSSLADKNEVGVTSIEAAYWYFESLLPLGVPTAPFPEEGPYELAYNADVQPAPTVTALSPSSGSIAGSTVTIAGTDFASVSAVQFGGVPAKSFTVGSEGQITAVPAATSKPGAVDVVVTTVAGSSPVTPAGAYTYTACTVPKLKKKSVKADRKALTKAGCKLGKVKKAKGADAKAKVTKQSLKPGTIKPVGAKVNVKVG